MSKNTQHTSMLSTLLLVLAVMLPSTFQAPVQQQTTTNKYETIEDAAKFLSQFGYLDNSVLTKNKNSAGPSDVVDLSQQLKRLQKFAGLKETGLLDAETKALMNKPRCHLPDVIQPINNNNSRRKRYATVGSKWRSTNLKYQILNYPTKSYDLSDQTDVQSALATAFNDWSSVANINFAKSDGSSQAQINIGFYEDNHGDGNPFDGRGVVLAHTFFPQDGRMHFDNAESWASGAPSSNSVNLRQVATHEIGHLIGLGHTTDRTAVMYPYYSYRSNFKLQSDDIRGGVALYGARTMSNNPTVSPNPNPTPYPSPNPNPTAYPSPTPNLDPFPTPSPPFNPIKTTKLTTTTRRQRCRGRWC